MVVDKSDQKPLASNFCSTIGVPKKVRVFTVHISDTDLYRPSF